MPVPHIWQCCYCTCTRRTTQPHKIFHPLPRCRKQLKYAATPIDTLNSLLQALTPWDTKCWTIQPDARRTYSKQGPPSSPVSTHDKTPAPASPNFVHDRGHSARRNTRSTITRTADAASSSFPGDSPPTSSLRNIVRVTQCHGTRHEHCRGATVIEASGLARRSKKTCCLLNNTFYHSWLSTTSSSPVIPPTPTRNACLPTRTPLSTLSNSHGSRTCGTESSSRGVRVQSVLWGWVEPARIQPPIARGAKEGRGNL